MSQELHLHFPDPAHVIVSLDNALTPALPFIPPLSAAELGELRWYLETYAGRYTTDVDDQRAARLDANLPRWGAALFAAVFDAPAVNELFQQFQNGADLGRLLTISAEHPRVLALPWELLRDPADDRPLFAHTPPIAIRRRLRNPTASAIQPKERLHVLMVISRPAGASFIDPRLDAQPLLDALKEHAAGRVAVEFLRLPTFKRLTARLNDRALPPVDIVHFDGHGVFDRQTNTGYLLFEDDDGERDLVPADKLGKLLQRRRLAMVVLSACQSATLTGDDDAEPADAMGSVAVRLTAAGMPAVLAMSYTVLVATTRQLFAEFYARLAQGEGIGAALDQARRQLYLYPERHEVRRGAHQKRLTLQDWFVPVLHQAGEDGALLNPHPQPLAQTRKTAFRREASVRHNLPDVQVAGFFGRSRELWQIERWYVQGARRISITGFGGQGKSYLAQEAGRWLLRTGLFDLRAVVFVSYAAFQGVDPVGYAVSTLATVLEKNLVDADAATTLLARTPTLLILDNLEALAGNLLRELLDAAALWSQAGASRVLITTRSPTFDHPGYANTGRHRYLPLAGLAVEEALAYYQTLWNLPPTATLPAHPRDDLLRLFAQVDYHPLSISLLAQQLKTHQPAELGERLQSLLVETPDNPLLASLNLSLERLPAEIQQWLPRLGVFQGGAIEPALLAITEIPEDEWPTVRAALHTTSLIEIEQLPNIIAPYLHFHPTLAPTLWMRLDTEQQAVLSTRHRQHYYELSDYLSEGDKFNPHAARAIIHRELPNLLHAVHTALTAGDADAVGFATSVNEFLDYFGLNRDRDHLTQRANEAAGTERSLAWFLARTSRGEQLLLAGRYAEAETIFQTVQTKLAGLDSTPGYPHCLTLGRLGRCLEGQGRPDQAATYYRQALAIAAQLEQTTGVQREQGILQCDLGSALTDIGDFVEARQAYETGLTIAKDQNDERQIGVVEGQLGTLALR